MRFSWRLTLFFAATLLAIQGVTMLAIQTWLRDTLIEDGKAQVAAAETRFVRQLSELENQLAEGVRLLTLDYALRQSIADHDAATVLSALRNHGHRVGASRMLLIGRDGTIDGDTGSAEANIPRIFPDPTLLEHAIEDDKAGRIAILDEKPVWLVAVPVMAPDLIAFVAAALPLDSDQLARMSEIAGVPGKIGIVGLTRDGWRGESGGIDNAVLRGLPEAGTPRIVSTADGGETIVTSHPLRTAPGAAPMRVVLDYSLSDALRRYRRMSFILLPILSIGLLATLVGATLISRGVARPIERLARQTERIAHGDYTPPPLLERADELGKLSRAMRGMTRAIADREESIRHQATYDRITGLANRAAIAGMIDGGTFAVGAVLVIGLIRWRTITSTVGHDVGDRLLRDAADRIRLASGRIGARVGCIGASAFAMLLADTEPGAARTVATSIVEAFDTPYKEADLMIDTPVAVGISLSPSHGTSAEQLLRRAEVAEGMAAESEVRICLYQPETDPHRPDRLSLMSELRVGLTRGEFQLVYQPKLDVRQGRITGAEALVRWHHPTRGGVCPDDFIALAEETGNVQHVTRWALRAGLTEAKRWRDQGLPARMAINLSVRDLTDDTLPTRISALLRELGFSSRSLVLEVTESAIMREPDAAVAVLRRLDELGIDLAIDDFGVGQSSLAYLRRLPVREIKLDKTFLTGLPRSPDDQKIVRSVIELAHGLGYRVTAEGVEDAPTLRLLREFDCDLAQGFYVGKPMSAQAFLGFAARKTGPRLDPETVP
jgi:diguanylate cyclase (GGDEF)-like protein